MLIIGHVTQLADYLRFAKYKVTRVAVEKYSELRDLINFRSYDLLSQIFTIIYWFDPCHGHILLVTRSVNRMVNRGGIDVMQRGAFYLSLDQSVTWQTETWSTLQLPLFMSSDQSSVTRPDMWEGIHTGHMYINTLSYHVINYTSLTPHPLGLSTFLGT